MMKFSYFGLLYLLVQVECWRVFHFGRSSGGNLGNPESHKLLSTENVTDKWFTQNLDHFNPNNEVTWKQV